MPFPYLMETTGNQTLWEQLHRSPLSSLPPMPHSRGVVCRLVNVPAASLFVQAGPPERSAFSLVSFPPPRACQRTIHSFFATWFEHHFLSQPSQSAVLLASLSPTVIVSHPSLTTPHIVRLHPIFPTDLRSLKERSGHNIHFVSQCRSLSKFSKSVCWLNDWIGE